MRLATLRRGGRDGALVVVDSERMTAVTAPGVPTLQAALDDWANAAPVLCRAAERERPFPVKVEDLHAPLPRAYQWAEASTYLVHMERLRAARGLALPPDHGRSPAVYNSGSDGFLAPTDPIPLIDEDFGLDIEATIAVITGDVPQGTSVGRAPEYIRLVVLVNDLTFRNLLGEEYAKGVGFFQCKPRRSVAPFAVTPDAIGDAWTGSMLRATVEVDVNGERIGSLDTSADSAFDFGEIIAHMARTRPLSAGSMIGAGTVANRDVSRGFGAIAEKRAHETSTSGSTSTGLLTTGDRIRIEAVDASGRSLFGAIDQAVASVDPS